MWQVMVSLMVVGFFWLPLIGAAVGAVTSIWGAKKKADAAKEAAKTQAASADKAMALERQMYEQNRADLSPWYNVGANAITTMGNLSGLGSFPGTSMGGGQAGPLSAMAPGVIGLGNALLARRGIPPTKPLAPMGLSQDALPPEPTAGSKRETLASLQAGSARPMNASGYAMMQAPDGSTQPVPVSQVPWYQQKGATLLEGGQA